MAIVLPHGVLFRGGEEGTIRKQLIEQNHIDAIIGLPANIFFGTGIPTVILVLRQKRSNTDVLVVDASKHFLKVGKNNKLQASDIKRIVDAVINRQDNKDSNPKFSKLVSKETLRANDYNLNIPRYVDSAAAAESWDLHATMLGGIPVSEINQFDHYWQAFPDLKKALFTNNSSHYAELAIAAIDVKHTTTQHNEVKSFAQSYAKAFSDFDIDLIDELIKQWEAVNIAQHEGNLSNALFTRLEKTRLNDIALIDQYQAYQLLDNHWQTIAADLEMLQTEGFEASKWVDPNMVNKKIKGKDTEVQEGWKGHIMPFDLVQTTLLNDELQALKQQENRLAEISAEYESIFESLNEEEKEADTIKESGDAFANAAVAKEAKQIKAELKQEKKKVDALDAESYSAKIIQVDTLITEEKALKKSVKKDVEALHLKTKATIENLSDEQVNNLLELKWITPLLGELSELPTQLIHQLTSQVQKLADKYAATYADVASEIKNTEQALAGLIDELTGNEFDHQGLAEFKMFLQGE